MIHKPPISKKTKSKTLSASETLKLVTELANKQTSSIDDLESLYLNEGTTFEVVLPHGAIIEFTRMDGSGEQKKFNKAKNAYATKMLGGLTQQKFLDELVIPGEQDQLTPARVYGPKKQAFAETLASRTDEDFKTAYLINKLCVLPGYSEYEAIRMTRMGKLVNSIEEQVEASLLKATSLAWKIMLDKAEKD